MHLTKRGVKQGRHKYFRKGMFGIRYSDSVSEKIQNIIKNILTVISKKENTESGWKLIPVLMAYRYTVSKLIEKRVPASDTT